MFQAQGPINLSIVIDGAFAVPAEASRVPSSGPIVPWVNALRFVLLGVFDALQSFVFHIVGSFRLVVVDGLALGLSACEGTNGAPQPIRAEVLWGDGLGDGQRKAGAE